MCISQTTAFWLSDQNMTFYKTRTYSREWFDFVKHPTWTDLFFRAAKFSIPKAVVDKERNKLEKGWHGISRKMTPTGEVVQWAHRVGRITRFASLTDQCHVKRAERTKHRQTHKRKSGGQEHGASKACHQQAADSQRSRKCMLQLRAVKKGE